MSKIEKKRILIFGGTGSLGKTLIKRYIEKNEVCVFSRDESKHWTIRNRLNDPKLQFRVGDIRDESRCREIVLEFQPTHIILASALKHVDVCENSPSESIKTNITGIENVVRVVKENESRLSNLEVVLMVSTDKACSPINVYGMCKSIAERVVTSATLPNKKIRFLSVRYGNVLESRGSIIPLFKYQSEHKDAITITDERMTRYVMTLDESVDLINEAMLNGNSGETWIPDLPAMSVKDLAQIFSEMSEKPVKIIGTRPGEKLHEDLINQTESMRSKKIGKYFVIMPSNTQPFQDKDNTLRSDRNLMTKNQLFDHLQKLKILTQPLSSFDGKNIEEIKT
tara:strand:- start:337 stop:1353 length:1017 start_codon:yes stop_codon:yes gene_type:complete